MGGTPGKSGRGNALVQFYRWVFGIGYERNIGGPERTIRYSLGALLVVAGLGVAAFPVLGSALANGVLVVSLLVCGAYLIYEARVRYCPLNHTLGRNTYAGD